MFQCLILDTLVPSSKTVGTILSQSCTVTRSGPLMSNTLAFVIDKLFKVCIISGMMNARLLEY